MADPVPDPAGFDDAEDAAFLTLRKKSWHESKQLRKRAAFLLEDVNLIPTDICFRVGAGDNVLDIHGHKIFFALGSPVFHAMLYGDLKEQKSIVEIPDVTPEAFQCMKTYIYSDNFSATISNVMDVLVVAKKYLVSKLKRSCYHFVQINMSPETVIKFWIQAREAADEIVEKQCVAEIKRNTSNVLLSGDLCTLPKAYLVELTSWVDLTVDESDLYMAMRKWKDNQERHGNEMVQFNREEGGLLEYIHFGLFSPQQLATGPVKDELFTLKEMQELYIHAFGAAAELTTFPNSKRNSVLPPFFMSLKIFLSRSDDMNDTVDMEWRLFDTLKLVIWPDVAPKACQLLRRYVESGSSFGVSYLTWAENSEMGLQIDRKLVNVATGKLAEKGPQLSETIEDYSAVWAAAGTVCFEICDEVPRLTLLSDTLEKTKLDGKEPISVFGKSNDRGLAIGKILQGSTGQLDELTHSEKLALNDYGFDDDNRPWALSPNFAHYTAFECKVVSEDGN